MSIISRYIWWVGLAAVITQVITIVRSYQNDERITLERHLFPYVFIRL